MSLRDLFPKLTEDNHEITSPQTIKYNCVAWAASDTQRWWQPGSFWPVDSTRDDHGIGTLIAAFEKVGYEVCDDGDSEPDVEKVALYGSALMYTHTARQLPDGRWTSKLGRLEDITHDNTDVIAGSDYGEVV